MTARKHSPEHDFWHAGLEPQIRAIIKAHPRWLVFTDENDERAFIKSLAKRIVGQVIGSQRELQKRRHPPMVGPTALLLTSRPSVRPSDDKTACQRRSPFAIHVSTFALRVLMKSRATVPHR